MLLYRKTRHLKQYIMKQINFIPIEEKTMNDKLVNLYGSHLVGLYTKAEVIYTHKWYKKHVKPAAPLLIELEEYPDGHYPYEEADVRVMIFGRETNNWKDGDRQKDAKTYTEYGTYNFHLQTNDDILAEIRGKHTDANGNDLPESEERKGLTDIYIDYLYRREEDGPNKGERIRTGKTPFTKWNYNFIDALQVRLGSKRVEFVWNNLFKIGKGNIGSSARGESPAFIRDIEKECFDVIRQEIEILKPDIIIFAPLTADNVIVEKFGLENSDFQLIDDKLPELRRIEIPGIKYAARTIHPAYKSNDILNEYNNALIEDILKHI